MRGVSLILMIYCSGIASQLISTDHVESLFRKLIKGDLSTQEQSMLNEVMTILHRNEHASSRSFETQSWARMTLDCLICRSAFATVFEGINDGQTDEEITSVVADLCTNLGVESQNVCTGAVELNIPIISYIIKNVPEATPAAFCGLLFQNAGNPNTCPLNDARFNWQVELPGPSPSPQLKTDPRPLTIAILTDAHIDPLYEAYGVADCDEPTCCRIGQSPAPRFRTIFEEENVEDYVLKDDLDNVMLNLSAAPTVRETRKSFYTKTDRSGWESEPAGFWGDYRNCDTPPWAFDDVIDRISETHKDIDVVYYIGDTIDHGIWETTYDLINNMNRYLIKKMRKSFGDDVLIIPVIGNHESQPTNQFAPSSVTGEKLNTTWLYEALARKWDYYLTDEAKETLIDRGDFSLLVRPGLRVISINNNVAYRYNWWLVYDPLDAKKHLDWLVEELHKAERAGEKVHILAHIPPGVHDLIHTWTREYNRIINRFSATISAEFNGHTHSDEFKVFYSPEGTPINVAWGGGSATSYTFYNLNYKLAYVNTATYVPEDIVNYSYNLTEANLTPQRRPHWFQLYDMRNTFGLSDLSAASMDGLVHRMVTTDKRLLDIYAAFYSKINDSRWASCNDNCKLDNLCKTVVTVLWERQRCEQLRNLFYSNAINTEDSYIKQFTNLILNVFNSYSKDKK